MACTAPTSEEHLGVTRLADGNMPEDALVVWHTLPSEMNCGEERQVTIDMLDYGTVTWNPGTYFLKAWQGPDPFQAPIQIDLPWPMEPGTTTSFRSRSAPRPRLSQMEL